jgi:hypothetical protein
MEFLAFVLLVGIVIYAVFRASHRKAIPPQFQISTEQDSPNIIALDPKNQVEAVSDRDVVFSTSRVMNGGESRVFYAAKGILRELGLSGWHVFPQVSLGEILKATGADTVRADRAYRSINSKRCDILIADRSGQPIAAIEYQGLGHDQGTARMRDAIKKIALERAGVLFIEIEADLADAALKARLMDRLRPLAPVLKEATKNATPLEGDAASL